MYKYDDIFTTKQRVLFVTAHPDDLVISFGGLILRLREDGKQVFVLLTTNGARGSMGSEVSEADLSDQRIGEEEKCLERLGIARDNLVCLGYKDGEVESDMKLIGEIAKYIRKFKVDLVATHNPMLQCMLSKNADGYYVQHRDHRKTGEAVIDAVYPFSRDRSFFREHYDEGLEPHSVYDILLVGGSEKNFEFDFTGKLEQKKAAMCEHKSQLSEDKVELILENSKSDGKYFEKFQYLKLLW